jgi:protein SCO1/2
MHGQYRGVWLILLLLVWPVEISSHDPSAAPKKVERREVRIPIQDFSLIDQNGRPFRLQQLKGRVVLIGFAYTTCPDVCPLITAAMRQVQSELRPTEKDSIYFLTITTDPEIDSPSVLSSYAKRYGVEHSNWTFLTGELESLTPVWKTFGVKVVRKSRGLIDHTPLTAVLDQRGIARVVYLGPAPEAKTIVGDIFRLLRRA